MSAIRLTLDVVEGKLSLKSSSPSTLVAPVVEPAIPMVGQMVAYEAKTDVYICPGG